MREPGTHTDTQLGGELEQISARIQRIEATLRPTNRALLLTLADYTLEPDSLTPEAREALTETLESYASLLEHAGEGVSTLGQILGLDIDPVEEETLPPTPLASQPDESSTDSHTHQPSKETTAPHTDEPVDNSDSVEHGPIPKDFDVEKDILALADLPEDLPEDSIVLEVDHKTNTIYMDPENHVEVSGKYRIAALNSIIFNVGKGTFVKRDLAALHIIEPNYPVNLKFVAELFKSKFGIELYTRQGTHSATKYIANPKLVFVDLQRGQVPKA